MTDKLRGCLLVAAFVACSLGLLSPRVVLADDAPIASGKQANGNARADILSLKRTEGDTVARGNACGQ
jgi:hypothetical protein